jgi:predicted adenylyl cyclase CyaB
MLEIEYKYQLPSTDEGQAVIKHLDNFGPATLIHENDFHGMSGPHYIRLRSTKRDDAVSHSFIYKGKATYPFPGGPKSRKELEVALQPDQVLEFKTIIAEMCDDPWPNVVKQRYYRKFGGVVITLDIVEDLGVFVEIEIVALNEEGISKLDEVATALGLDPSWKETESYGKLLRKRQAQRAELGQ